MRHVNDQWSPQSEELPLHRVIDMTLFLAKVIFDADRGEVHFPQGTFEGQIDDDIRVAPEPLDTEQETAYHQFLDLPRREFIRERLNALLQTLNELRNNEQI